MPYEKVGKAEPVCIADEVPFEIPDSWEWVRLGNIFNIRSAMRIHQTDWQTSGIPFFRGRELVQLIKTGNVDFEIYLSRELYEKNKVKGGVPQKDDILITAVGTIGQTYIVKGTQEFYYKDAYILCLENIGHVLIPEYIKMVLDSPFSQNDIHKDAMATTVAQLTIIKANSLFIPIPPVEEQKRIIKMLNDIAPHIMDYDKNETKLSNINRRFPDILKKSILQQAVMGKLVPQDPNDEPASVLLEQIRAEKQELIKAGKLKKDRHESIIYRRDNSHYEKLDGIERCIDDEIPFDIPESWAWCRLNELTIKEIKRGKSPVYSDYGKAYVFAQKCNVKTGGIDMTLAKYLSDSAFDKYPPEEYLLNNDIVVNSTGNGTLGRIGLFHDTDRIGSNEIVPDSHVTILRNSPLISTMYIYYVLKYYQPYLEKQGEGSTNQTELKPAVIANLLVPLPPYNEQISIEECITRSFAMIVSL